MQWCNRRLQAEESCRGKQHPRADHPQSCYGCLGGLLHEATLRASGEGPRCWRSGTCSQRPSPSDNPSQPPCDSLERSAEVKIHQDDTRSMRRRSTAGQSCMSENWQTLMGVNDMVGLQWGGAGPGSGYYSEKARKQQSWRQVQDHKTIAL